jgi:serine/threonine protein kinase
MTFFFFFRSYGSVFKAIHKESGQVVAIKQVPVESDLQEIIKEISIMQQCDRYEKILFFVFILMN